MTFLKALFGSSALNKENFEVLDKNRFKKAISQKNVQLVDVRTPREYNSGHIAKALNIDLFQRGIFKESFENLDKGRPVYVYCRSGSRSRKAAHWLVEMGFEKVYDLKGGYMNWD